MCVPHSLRLVPDDDPSPTIAARPPTYYKHPVFFWQFCRNFRCVHGPLRKHRAEAGTKNEPDKFLYLLDPRFEHNISLISFSRGSGPPLLLLLIPLVWRGDGSLDTVFGLTVRFFWGKSTVVINSNHRVPRAVRC